MEKCKHFLPGFRTTCIIVSVLFIFLAGSLFSRGLMTSMAEFKVPHEQLNSPHFYNAISWVYLHMIVIGLIIGVAGLYAEGERFKLAFSWLMFLANAVYTYLDFVHSDSVLGNGLYKGNASVFPAIISLAVTLLFLHLGICAASRKIKNPRTQQD
ncbi:MAG: hypothetical protein EOP53_16140 [Sphingobacteriales bacterium]|nr:MAG: hypothetical protein EOP53_16140 [Sphingobacteriales bacterium]